MQNMGNLGNVSPPRSPEGTAALAGFLRLVLQPDKATKELAAAAEKCVEAERRAHEAVAKVGKAQEIDKLRSEAESDREAAAKELETAKAEARRVRRQAETEAGEIKRRAEQQADTARRDLEAREAKMADREADLRERIERVNRAAVT